MTAREGREQPNIKGSEGGGEMHIQRKDGHCVCVLYPNANRNHMACDLPGVLSAP